MLRPLAIVPLAIMFVGTIFPLHVSDGGGVSDRVRRVREILVQTEVESYIKHIFPEVSYHPLAIPKSREVDLDNQTISILDVTHMALNISNPALSQDCWLCMTLYSHAPCNSC